MATTFSYKQPSEAYAISFNFSAYLGTETIASATITAVDQATLTNETATILDGTRQTNNTTTVSGWVQNGTSDHNYLITCRIVGSAGSLYELEGILPVLEVTTAVTSRNWAATRDNIIYAALRKLGVKEQENPPTAEEIQNASFALNSLVNSWQNDDVHLWTISDEILPLTASTISYPLGATVMEIMNPLFRRDDSDSPLNILTREEYMGISDKKTTADPISLYADYQLSSPVVYVWPRPTYGTTIVTGTDSLYYLCIKTHTSATADRPITGANYSTYWQLTTTSPNTTWGASVAYYSDVIRYSKVIRLQDFDLAADSPDFPARWMQALIYGLASDLSPEFGLKDMWAQRAQYEYAKARRMNFDNTDLRVVLPRR